MKICSIVGAVILSALSVPVLAGGVTVQELSATDREGDFPVCFNGAGELLPCASNIVIPPIDDPYTGLWSGRMIYDRFYVGNNTCYDADVEIRLDPDGDYWEIVSITIERDVGGIAIYVRDLRLSSDGYVADDFKAFDIWTDFSLQFNLHGNANGVWSDSIGGDCRGTWSITKE